MNWTNFKTSILFTAFAFMLIMVFSWKDEPIIYENEISQSAAEKLTNAYRESNPNETHLVVHDVEAIKRYIDSNFLKFTSKVLLEPGYEWALAFAPMYVNVNGKNRLTFSLLPCIKNDCVPGTIIDFWDSLEGRDIYYDEYFKPLMDSVQSAGLVSFIFDEGQLWP